MKDGLSVTEMKEIKNVPYTFVVGVLVYFIIFTRPDIAYVIGAVSRHLASPGKHTYEQLN